MKKLIYGVSFLALIGIMAIGCQKENLSNPINTNNNTGIDVEDITQRIKNSEDYLTLMKEQQKSTSKLLNSLFKPFEVDWFNPKIKMNEDGGYAILFNVIDVHNTNNLKGNLIAIYVDNKIKVFYESFHEFDLKLGGNINYYYRTLESKMRVGTIVTEKGILIGNDIELPQQNGWWGCTTNCYKDASDACDGDPECKTLCDGLGSICTAELMIACGIHCL